MKRLVTAFLAAGITVSSMTAVFAEPAHKETGTGTAADRQLTADFRRSPGDAVKDLYRQAAPFSYKGNHFKKSCRLYTFRHNAVCEKNGGERDFVQYGKRRSISCGTASRRF